MISRMEPAHDFRYTVACRFEGEPADLVTAWLAWLIPGHLDDVLAAGAQAAEVVQIDDDVPHFEIRYQFESRAAFQAYERDHAPRLRADGLSRFPLESGLSFRRTTGQTITRRVVK